MMECRLIVYTPAPDYVCARAAAKCYKSKPSDNTLRKCIASGHSSVAEHASFTFEVSGVSRVLLAQITRHRHASYSVESQRYVRIEDMEESSVIPQSIIDAGVDVRALMGELQNVYNRLVDAGVPQEDARYLLPQAAATSFIITMNARELLHFFSLRCCNRAQWEIRDLANRMRAQCMEVAPVLFETCGAPCQCNMPCPERHPCGHPLGRKGNQ